MLIGVEVVTGIIIVARMRPKGEIFISLDPKGEVVDCNDLGTKLLFGMEPKPKLAPNSGSSPDSGPSPNCYPNYIPMRRSRIISFIS